MVHLCCVHCVVVRCIIVVRMRVVHYIFAVYTRCCSLHTCASKHMREHAYCICICIAQNKVVLAIDLTCRLSVCFFRNTSLLGIWATNKKRRENYYENQQRLLMRRLSRDEGSGV